MGSSLFIGGNWIPDSSVKRDSGFLELYSGFQSQKIPDSKAKNSGFPYINITTHTRRLRQSTTARFRSSLYKG